MAFTKKNQVKSKIKFVRARLFNPAVTVSVQVIKATLFFSDFIRVGKDVQLMNVIKTNKLIIQVVSRSLSYVFFLLLLLLLIFYYLKGKLNKQLAIIID